MSLRFFAKVAFICNIYFIAALVLRYRQFITQQDVTSHIVLLGWLISPLANIIFTVWWGLSKKGKAAIPIAIGIANIVFLLVQIYLFFILH